MAPPAGDSGAALGGPGPSGEASGASSGPGTPPAKRGSAAPKGKVSAAKDAADVAIVVPGSGGKRELHAKNHGLGYLGAATRGAAVRRPSK